MKKKRRAHYGIGNALRTLRLAKGLSQESFDQVSSRTYLSTVERGIKNPTLAKLELVAGQMGVHPLTLITLAYMESVSAKALSGLQQEVNAQLSILLDLT